MPEVEFPAHWAPEAMVFVSGSTGRRSIAAVRSCRSTARESPAGPVRLLVAFVPFNGDKPSGTSEEFATGFAGPTPPADPMSAPHRSMGLAVGPDGALVSDDVKGRIWRITAAADSTR